MTQAEEDQKKYQQIYENFLIKDEAFYYEVEAEQVILGMYLYDADMKPLGTCIFALNKNGIVNNYENL
jgi:hypothetical protein